MLTARLRRDQGVIFRENRDGRAKRLTRTAQGGGDMVTDWPRP